MQYNAVILFEIYFLATYCRYSAFFYRAGRWMVRYDGFSFHGFARLMVG